jgi:hypothetical protein
VQKSTDIARRFEFMEATVLISDFRRRWPEMISPE